MSKEEFKRRFELKIERIELKTFCYWKKFPVIVSLA